MDQGSEPMISLSQPSPRLSPQKTTAGTPAKQSSSPADSTQSAVLAMVRPKSVPSRTSRRVRKRLRSLFSRRTSLGSSSWAAKKLSTLLKLLEKARLIMPALSLKLALNSRRAVGKGNHDASSRISCKTSRQCM